MRACAFLLLAIAALMAASCSDGNPIGGALKGIGRSANDFIFAGTIFGDNPPASDCDVATVVNGLGAGNIGSAYINPMGHEWSVAVALVKDVNNHYSGVYRFMGPSYQGPLFNVTPTGNDGDTRFIKVDACYFDRTPTPPPPDYWKYRWIEVSFAMQVWDSVGLNWEIRVRVMRFKIVSGAPVMIDQHLFSFPAVNDDIQPDISYDPESGNLVLVYSHHETPGDASWVPVYYRCTDRQLGIGDPYAFYWTDPAYASKQGDGAPNGWTPRVDVGYVEDAPLFEGSHKLVAVAYTGQFSNDIPGEDDEYPNFVTRVTYWEADWSGDDEGGNDYPIFDSPWLGNDAGLPVVDISPQCNAAGYHKAGIAYVQCTGNLDEAYVCFMDSMLNDFLYLPDPDSPIDEFDYAAYPSVAMHFQDSGDTIDASVSFVAQDNAGPWLPWAAYVTFDDSSSQVVQYRNASMIRAGTWGIGPLLEHNYGVSTALTVFDEDNNYWLLYSGLVGMSATPTVIYGAFGNTTL